ncbi:MAG: ABC transporter permease [Actinomycetota bacterium]|nr:ABC transporter permease [Actinomycetota bacterium]
MTTYALRDWATMVRRSLRHMQRYPALTFMLVLLPVVFLLLFVYVFGATLGVGLGDASGTPTGDRATYVSYVAAAILLLTVASAATASAISVATDMTEGIIDRFRTMAIWRPSVLVGHVLASMIQTLLAVAVVIAVAVLVGFRPSAGALEWLAAVGVLAMISLPSRRWLSLVRGAVQPEPSGPRHRRPPGATSTTCVGPGTQVRAHAASSTLDEVGPRKWRSRDRKDDHR